MESPVCENTWHNFITPRTFINFYHYLTIFICTIKGGAKIIYFFTVSSLYWENGSIANVLLEEITVNHWGLLLLKNNLKRY